DRVALLDELQVALAAGDRAFEGLLLLVGGLGHDQEAQDQSQAQTYLDSCLHRKPPHTWFQSSPRTVGRISSRDGDYYSLTTYSRQSSSGHSGEKIFRSSNRPAPLTYHSCRLQCLFPLLRAVNPVCRRG